MKVKIEQPLYIPKNLIISLESAEDEQHFLDLLKGWNAKSLGKAQCPHSIIVEVATKLFWDCIKNGLGQKP